MAILTIQNQGQTESDIDGNVYHTVTIGTQVWMVENLKTTRYSDGSIVPRVSTYNETTNADTINTYGRLYDWDAALHACPDGWHVPSDAEWTILADYLGGHDVAGGKMKEAGTVHWKSPNTGANNYSGFTALPGGYRFASGTFFSMGVLGMYWSSTTETLASAGRGAWRRLMSANNIELNRYDYGKVNRLSVRCLKDANTSSKGMAEDGDITFHPNPANDRLWIGNVRSANSSIYFFNLTGELVLFKQDVTNPVDISHLRNGFYILRFIDSGKTKTARLVKEGR
ncbi:MAG: hypothetical protein A2X22_10910 [Bacteroidetes bacterium GWF2_49_14]|nr:MAG: hypothetical protein A2X22_10910 [Bacteroidetes bacterium GWF2_49_14]